PTKSAEVTRSSHANPMIWPSSDSLRNFMGRPPRIGAARRDAVPTRLYATAMLHAPRRPTSDCGTELVVGGAWRRRGQYLRLGCREQKLGAVARVDHEIPCLLDRPAV